MEGRVTPPLEVDGVDGVGVVCVGEGRLFDGVRQRDSFLEECVG